MCRNQCKTFYIFLFLHFEWRASRLIDYRSMCASTAFTSHNANITEAGHPSLPCHDNRNSSHALRASAIDLEPYELIRLWPKAKLTNFAVLRRKHAKSELDAQQIVQPRSFNAHKQLKSPRSSYETGMLRRPLWKEIFLKAFSCGLSQKDEPPLK